MTTEYIRYKITFGKTLVKAKSKVSKKINDLPDNFRNVIYANSGMELEENIKKYYNMKSVSRRRDEWVFHS